MMNINVSALATKYLSVLAATALLIAAFVFGSMTYSGFFSLQTFFNLFIDKSFLLVSAAGMSLVILSGGIDLSVGAVVALSTMIISALVEFNGMHPLPAMAITLAAGTLIGYGMGLMVAFWDVPPFIATLAGMFFARGACYLINVQSIAIKHPFMHSLGLWKLNFGDSFISLNVVIALVVTAIAIYISLYTKFGRNVYAIGGNESSALLMGIPVRRTKVAVYAINGFCSAVAGVVFSLYMLSGHGLYLVGMELDVIAAVVIGGTLLSGGTGFVFGSAIGVLTLTIIQALIMFDGRINSWWTKIVVGVLLLAFIGLQRLIVAFGDKKGE
jgi:simple sugar transport system permease protein